MGTLPSSSLLNLNLGFFTHKSPLSPLQRSLSRNTCFLCKNPPSILKSRIRFDNLRRFSIGDVDDEKSGLGSSTDEVNDELPASVSPPSPPPSRASSIPSDGSVYSSFQVDSIKLMELLGPEKVDPSDVKLIKEKLFGYSTFWVTREEPFGDLGEGVLFLGNLRGKREDVFARLQLQLNEVTGDKYNLFMVEEPNSEGPDPRGGPRVSFGLLRKEVSEPGATTLWQYVIALLLIVYRLLCRARNCISDN